MYCRTAVLITTLPLVLAGDSSWDDSAAPPAYLQKNKVLREHVQALNAFSWGKWTWAERLKAVNDFEASAKKHVSGKGTDENSARGWYYFNQKTQASQYERPKQLGHPEPKQGNRLFWQDPDTGASVWEPPTKWAWEKVQDGSSERPYYFNTKTKETVWELPEDAAWERIEKPHYWWNEVTGKTSNERPPEVGIEDKHHPGVKYWTDPRTGQQTWTKPKEYDWQVTKEMHNGELREYYFNPHTKEAVWEKPSYLGWKRVSKDDTYWYNSITKKSQYNRPAELGVVTDDPKHGTLVYWEDPVTKKPTYSKPSIWDWIWTKATPAEAQNAGQSHYYYSRHSDQKQWEMPEALAWQELPVYHEAEEVVQPEGYYSSADSGDL